MSEQAKGPDIAPQEPPVNSQGGPDAKVAEILRQPTGDEILAELLERNNQRGQGAIEDMLLGSNDPDFDRRINSLPRDQYKFVEETLTAKAKVERREWKERVRAREAETRRRLDEEENQRRAAAGAQKKRPPSKKKAVWDKLAEKARIAVAHMDSGDAGPSTSGAPPAPTKTPEVPEAPEAPEAPKAAETNAPTNGKEASVVTPKQPAAPAKAVKVPTTSSTKPSGSREQEQEKSPARLVGKPPLFYDRGRSVVASTSKEARSSAAKPKNVSPVKKPAAPVEKPSTSKPGNAKPPVKKGIYVNPPVASLATPARPTGDDPNNELDPAGSPIMQEDERAPLNLPFEVHEAYYPAELRNTAATEAREYEEVVVYELSSRRASELTSVYSISPDRDEEMEIDEQRDNNQIDHQEGPSNSQNNQIDHQEGPSNSQPQKEKVPAVPAATEIIQKVTTPKTPAVTGVVQKATTLKTPAVTEVAPKVATPKTSAVTEVVQKVAVATPKTPAKEKKSTTEPQSAKKKAPPATTPALPDVNREIKEEEPDDSSGWNQNSAKHRRSRKSEADRLKSMDFGPKQGGSLADIESHMEPTRRRTKAVESTPLRETSRRRRTMPANLGGKRKNADEDDSEEDDDIMSESDIKMEEPDTPWEPPGVPITTAAPVGRPRKYAKRIGPIQQVTIHSDSPGPSTRPYRKAAEKKQTPPPLTSRQAAMARKKERRTASPIEIPPIIAKAIQKDAETAAAKSAKKAAQAARAASKAGAAQKKAPVVVATPTRANYAPLVSLPIMKSTPTKQMADSSTGNLPNVTPTRTNQSPKTASIICTAPGIPVAGNSALAKKLIPVGTGTFIGSPPHLKRAADNANSGNSTPPTTSPATAISHSPTKASPSGIPVNISSQSVGSFLQSNMQKNGNNSAGNTGSPANNGSPGNNGNTGINPGYRPPGMPRFPYRPEKPAPPRQPQVAIAPRPPPGATVAEDGRVMPMLINPRVFPTIEEQMRNNNSGLYHSIKERSIKEAIKIDRTTLPEQRLLEARRLEALEGRAVIGNKEEAEKQRRKDEEQFAKDAIHLEKNRERDRQMNLKKTLIKQRWDNNQKILIQSRMSQSQQPDAARNLPEFVTRKRPLISASGSSSPAPVLTANAPNEPSTSEPIAKRFHSDSSPAPLLTSSAAGPAGAAPEFEDCSPQDDCEILEPPVLEREEAMHQEEVQQAVGRLIPIHLKTNQMDYGPNRQVPLCRDLQDLTGLPSLTANTPLLSLSRLSEKKEKEKWRALRVPTLTPQAQAAQAASRKSTASPTFCPVVTSDSNLNNQIQTAYKEAQQSPAILDLISNLSDPTLKPRRHRAAIPRPPHRMLSEMPMTSGQSTSSAPAHNGSQGTSTSSSVRASPTATPTAFERVIADHSANHRNATPVSTETALSRSIALASTSQAQKEGYERLLALNAARQFNNSPQDRSSQDDSWAQESPLGNQMVPNLQLAANRLKVGPQPPPRTADYESSRASVYIPPNCSLDFTTWKGSDLQAWTDLVFAPDGHELLHKTIAKEQLDGNFLLDLHIIKSIREDLGIPYGIFTQLKYHSAAVLNVYFALKYDVEYRQYEADLAEFKKQQSANRN